jgi:GNAT superfamily N-acetyltransferase
MACLLQDLPKENLGPRKFRVETITDFSLFDHHRHPFHGNGEWRSVATALIQIRPKRVWHFLAWFGDRPIGSSTLLIAAGVAGIYDVGVLAEHRRQGIGAEITAAACRFASQLGFHVAVLISSPLGQSPYRRVGFKEICRVEECNLSVEAQQETPLAPHEKVLFLAAHDGRHNELQLALKKYPKMIRLQNQSAVGLLDVAACAGQLEVAEWLLDQGATMNPITAYELGWADRISEMTRSDPDIVSRRVGNLSPLHIAILRRDTGEIRDMELVRILVECGADLAAVDDQHRSTPLGWAQAFNDEEAIEFLRSYRSPD